MREAIVPPSRRGAARAYSPAVAFGDLIFTSGLTAADPVSGAIPTGIEAQTRRCFEKLDDILQAGGSSLGQVLRVTVYLTDVAAQQAPMTAVYREVFPADPPARTTVQVAALSSPDKLIEIEAIAARTPEGSR
ncbi:MAG: RidA family protein [Chloroflexi bacterium]|nr:RidA family protein [Chloroflexota bacterium]